MSSRPPADTRHPRKRWKCINRDKARNMVCTVETESDDYPDTHGCLIAPDGRHVWVRKEWED